MSFGKQGSGSGRLTRGPRYRSLVLGSDRGNRLGVIDKGPSRGRYLESRDPGRQPHISRVCCATHFQALLAYRPISSGYTPGPSSPWECLRRLWCEYYGEELCYIGVYVCLATRFWVPDWRRLEHSCFDVSTGRTLTRTGQEAEEAEGDEVQLRAIINHCK
ncbi:hypothetical protein B7494_g6374 [Chlorociboria aeruginascens]|nr:hypothetical protein B7494_g6374 [Chlorociboria aeruginascens]